MLYAQHKVSSTYKKYSRVANTRRVSGVEVAQVLVQANRLEVGIEGTRGRLTDHYDPRNKVLRFSREVYHSASVAALGIVAHEVGHAIQDKVSYAPMRLRSALMPMASLGTSLGYIFIILGFLLYFLTGTFGLTVAWIGVLLFAGAVLFSLVTLPVEYNASNRAREMLLSNGLVSAKEYKAASAVLSAAALTYVAAILQALAQLFYFLFALLGMSRR